MSTRPQIAMIHTLKSKIGMTDDGYRAMLGGFGAESSKDLSTADAKVFIETLMRLVGGSKAHPAYTAGDVGALAAKIFGARAAGDETPAGKPRGFARGGAATPRQQEYIRRLWYSVSRAADPDRALNVFLENRFHVSHVAWLPQERVGKVIHALKAMQSQTKTKEEVING